MKDFSVWSSSIKSFSYEFCFCYYYKSISKGKKSNSKWNTFILMKNTILKRWHYHNIKESHLAARPLTSLVWRRRIKPINENFPFPTQNVPPQWQCVESHWVIWNSLCQNKLRENIKMLTNTAPVTEWLQPNPLFESLCEDQTNLLSTLSTSNQTWQ